MRICARLCRWHHPLLITVCFSTLMEATQAVGQETSRILKSTNILVDPAAVNVFPSAQFDAACSIIEVAGLGLLDGDYSLLDRNPRAAAAEPPSWIGMSGHSKHALLSWHSVERVWTIGMHGLNVYRAFVPFEPDIPPSRSTQWRVFDAQLSAFRNWSNDVSISCPACMAVTVSLLSGALAQCNGPYRHRAVGINKPGEIVWLHVNDERCVMTHRRNGMSRITMTGTHKTSTVPPGCRLDGMAAAATADAVDDLRPHFPKTGRDQADFPGEAVSSAGEREETGSATVLCTSAGRTTRLAFSLAIGSLVYDESHAERFREKSYVGENGYAVNLNTPSMSERIYELKSAQDGSIISSAQNNVHILIARRHHEASSIRAAVWSRDESMRLQESDNTDHTDNTYNRNDHAGQSGARSSPRQSSQSPSHVEIMVDGVKALITSLDILSNQGALMSLDGMEGTNVIELCLFDDRTEKYPDTQRLRDILDPQKGELDQHVEQSGEGTAAGRSVEHRRCIARTVLTLEVFLADAHMVHRRYSRDIVTPSPSQMMMMRKDNSRGEGDLDVGDAGVDDTPSTRVLFVIDLQVVDGYKLSTLHLMKHLPDHFETSTIDLTCASGELPVKALFDQEAGEPVRVCVSLPTETWNTAGREDRSMPAYLYFVLLNAETWEEVTRTHSGVALGLQDIYDCLKKFDALVMSNAGKDNDAYLLHLARLAGVVTRMVNIGAIAGGLLSPLYTGATSFVGPSQYVAHNPSTIRNARGLPIKVCHPVMDAERVLEAGAACGTDATPPQPQSVASQHQTRLDGLSEKGNTLDEFTPTPTLGRLGRFLGGHASTRSNGDDDGNTTSAATADDRDENLPTAVFITVGRFAVYKTPGMFVRAMGVLQRRFTSQLRVKREAGKGRTHKSQQHHHEQRHQYHQHERQGLVPPPSNIKGVMVGTGPLLDPMMTLARDLDVNIRFAGFLHVDTVPCEVRRATALVMPSISPETFGMVGPEAMLLGVPVVTFGFGGTAELVRHMENGLVVAEATPRALADALERLARDPGLRNRLGAQAQRDARRMLSMPEMVACHAKEFHRRKERGSTE